MIVQNTVQSPSKHPRAVTLEPGRSLDKRSYINLSCVRHISIDALAKPRRGMNPARLDSHSRHMINEVLPTQPFSFERSGTVVNTHGRVRDLPDLNTEDHLHLAATPRSTFTYAASTYGTMLPQSLAGQPPSHSQGNLHDTATARLLYQPIYKSRPLHHTAIHTSIPSSGSALASQRVAGLSEYYTPTEAARHRRRLAVVSTLGFCMLLFIFFLLYDAIQRKDHSRGLRLWRWQ
ncbi:hypothetical protein K461DRAFT_100832 [Myriangium duriaei CBS 260.36]|uniref:Uncharacterized protein n=1 Tax=Myriangium duriaei CBS 260.36 TaxID=1168546 RepID=A0A9P4J3E4_9PEZI|nr:hypothetical protein K461DRAFT_100832 [Myriangium duriaei CBS 260.36]